MAEHKHAHVKPAMVKVIDLKPGDVVQRKEELYTYVTQQVHPLDPANQLVIWRVHKDGSHLLESLPILCAIGKLVKKATKQQLEWGLGL